MNLSIKTLLAATVIGMVAATSHASLIAGDIAIISVHTDTTKDFSFVALTDITSGTQIFFTDSGWLAANSFRGNEGAQVYTAPSNITAGTVISWTGNAADFAAANDTNVGTNGFVLSTSGDQVFAFVGSSASPTFLFAVQTNSSQYQADAASSNDSAVPQGLTVGTNAVAVGAGPNAGDEFDNSQYVGPRTGTKAQLLAAIADSANWSGDNNPITLNNSAFTITPEPASLALLALGGLTLITRRRKA